MNRQVERWLEILVRLCVPGTYSIDCFARESVDPFDSVYYQDGCIVIDGKRYRPFNLGELIDREHLRGKWIYNDATEDESMIIGFDMNENEVVTSIEQFECHIPGKEWSNKIGCISLLFNARFENGEPCGWYVGKYESCHQKRLTLLELEQLARDAIEQDRNGGC